MQHSERISIKTGTDDFSELLLEGGIFVDKSLMVRNFVEDTAKVVLITRPRRWGKSVNMSMLEYFLAIQVDDAGNALQPEQSLNHKLFAGGDVVVGPQTGKTKHLAPLKVAQQCPELLADYQGQYPVISLSLKGVKMGTYEAIKKGVNKQINGLFKSHGYLLKSPQISENEVGVFKQYAYGSSDEVDLADSLRFLSELLHRHFQRPAYVFVDEYDTPIHSAYLKFGKQDPEQLEQVLELFRTLLGAVFKGNIHLKQGLITGILRIAKANLFSDLNNVSEYTLLDEPFAPCYGFTESEVIDLMQQVPTKTSIEEIRHWYNGYTFGGQDVRMYNPWSIMRCLASKGKLDHYWIDSGGMALLDKVLLSDEMQEEIQLLVNGGTITSQIYTKISFETLQDPLSIYSLLLFGGYLNPDALQDRDDDVYVLSIPNREVRRIYKDRVLHWVTKKLSTHPHRLAACIQPLITGHVSAFQEELRELLSQGTSFYQVGVRRSEVFYSGFMLCLYALLCRYYSVSSERESGLGRADALLIPKSSHGDEALVLEYKVAKEAAELEHVAQVGLIQMQEKGYSAKVKEHAHVRSVLQVSLAFCGKEVAVLHERVEL
ncbi:MAG: AAA family ATPase [Bacteroidota bacterium]